MARTSTGYRIQAALQIHRLIAAGKYPNATTLARALGVKIKTVRGYLRLLTETFQAEPKYDPQRHGYYYESEPRPGLMPLLSEDEVVVVFLLDEAARALAGSPVEELLNSVQRKLALMIPARYQLSLDEVGAALSLRQERAAAVPEQRPEILQTFFRAARQQQRVECVYQGRQRRRRTRRKLDPLHLTRCEGQWYLVAYCHLRRAIRTFVPARMQAARMLAEHFERPAGFDPQAHFRTAFGIVAGLNTQEIVLRFTPRVAQLIRERRWHTTQALTSLPGGSVRLSMTCSQGEELLAWLLSWGAQVTVESPPALAKRVRAEHQRACNGRPGKSINNEARASGPPERRADAK